MKSSIKNRVLMIVENNPFPQDGRVRREAGALTETGYRVSVIAPRSKGQLWRENVKGVEVFRYPAPPEANGLWGYLWEYGYSLAAAFVLSVLVFFSPGFDVIHAHNPPDILVLIGLFYKLFGKQFVFDHHDLSPEMYCARFGGKGNRWVYQALVFFEKLSCKLARHVIVTNQSYKKMVIKRSNVPEAQITIVRNGPDLNRLRLVEPDPDLQRRGKTIIGYVGVMGFQDGIDYLLRALHLLAYELKRTDFYVIIIGTGDAWDSLRKLTTQLKLDEFVGFTGRISDADLMRYLSTADICVDPDPYNPFNDRSSMIKMTEYMALGKPIVAFDLTEHRVTAQSAAVYARPNDELDFARRIAALMDNPAQRQKMGKIGRERIDKKLAWPFQKQKLLEAYATISTNIPKRRSVSVPKELL